ncbi:MAG: hypothetical protein QXS54_03660 [Candidatus Methanomethylicaceae archaeon]
MDPLSAVLLSAGIGAGTNLLGGLLGSRRMKKAQKESEKQRALENLQRAILGLSPQSAAPVVDTPSGFEIALQAIGPAAQRVLEYKAMEGLQKQQRAQNMADWKEMKDYEQKLALERERRKQPRTFYWADEFLSTL